MKRLVILLSMVMLFITGCSVTKLDDTDIGKNMKTLLSQDNKLYNVHYSGYKYYLPKGISFVDKDDYNSVLSDSHGNKHYMFVDAISYYHKVENKYQVNEKAYYSSLISKYKENKDALKVYFIDLNNELNKKYYNVNNDNISNKNAKSISELDLGDITLIKISNKEINAYIDDITSIENILTKNVE